MTFDHIQDQLFDAIADVEDALDSLGGAEVEYMTTDELSHVLDVLGLTATGIRRFAKSIIDRQPVSPEVEQMLREFEANFRSRRHHPARRECAGEASISAPRANPSP
ncbi:MULTISPECIES: hypothetical protein [unclassified Mycobacterium]|uniref:hypothetical protein n=1 Tax=unclassified Mycobacterium TaxID=2642494 RepID=UPI0029C6F12C|nr:MULTISPECIES: hypothetical protein [unclassified Mycobacterium]